MRYFLSYLLIPIKIPKKDSNKCARLLKAWLKEEKGKGPRACYLEAIASMAAQNPGQKELASDLIYEALKSPVASYSARARQIVLYNTTVAI